MSGTVQRAEALELFGKCLIGTCEKDEGQTNFIDPRIYQVELEVDPSAPEAIGEAIKAASELWRGREEAVAGSAGLVARSKGDYRRILAALYNTGRYAGQISIRVNGSEAAELTAGQEMPYESKVTINVSPGQRYLFGRALVINQAPAAFNEDDRVELPEDNGFATGETARADVVRKAAALFREAWRQQGHPTARILSKTATANHPANQLNVALELDPGPKAVYGDLVVNGVQDMDPAFVAYMTGIKPGQEYDPDDLKRAHKRLDRLGVFSSRKIQEAEQVGANGMLPLTLMVQEKKQRRLGLGATLSTVDGAGLEAYWLHRNLMGKAEQLRFDAKFGGFGASVDPDQFDYSLGVTLTQPGVFSPDTDLTWNAYGKREYNETFIEKGAGASATVTHFLSDKTVLSGGVFTQFGKFQDIFGTRQFITAGLHGNVLYDGRDSKVEPTSGVYAALDVKPFYEFEVAQPAARVEAEARTYLAVDEEARTVLAGRVKVGSLVGAGISQSPPSFLFNAGGGSSVRGFEYKGIGVTNALGQESGGKSLFEASLELRQRVYGNFGVVAFADAGTVGSNSLIEFSEDVKIGVGGGIRYYTGLGPIRVDVAFPLNKTRGDSDFALYAGIGQAF